MPKPFGKVARRKLGLTKWMRLVLALWAAAVPAFMICRGPARERPTLAEDAFFWPSAVVLWIAYAAGISTWLRRRPSPRGPWESSRARIFIARFLLALLLAAPAGLATAYLYHPALTVANATISIGEGAAEYALVVKDARGFALDSPYWTPPFSFRPPDAGSLPRDLTAGSLAKLTLCRGILGSRWVKKIDFEILR